MPTETIEVYTCFGCGKIRPKSHYDHWALTGAILKDGHAFCSTACFLKRYLRYEETKIATTVLDIRAENSQS